MRGTLERFEGMNSGAKASLSSSRWLHVFLIAYLAAILYASRGITLDSHDGLLAVLNSFRLAGLPAADAGLGRPDLNFTRPPLGCLLLVPAVAWGYRLGGLLTAIKACHFVMCCFSVAVLWISHKHYARLFSPDVASFTVLSMAVNPLLLRYAPFALFDIFSALCALPFLWAGYRYFQNPGLRSYLLLLGAYALAVLTRYHFIILILVPLAYGFLIRGSGGLRSRMREGRTLPLSLLPALAYLICVVFIALVLSSFAGDSLLSSFKQANRDFWRVVFTNVAAHDPVSWHKYLDSLWAQLGVALFLLMLLGMGAWIKGGKQPELYLSLSLAVPLAFMSLAIASKEQRYLLGFLPLVYAAVAQGIETLLSMLPGRPFSRAAVMASILLLVPWRQSRASWNYLLREPSMRSAAPWRLGEILKKDTPSGDCVGWISRDMVFHAGVAVIDNDEQTFILGHGLASLFVPARIAQMKDMSSVESRCRVSMIVEPLEFPAGRIPSPQDVLARVYQVLGDGKRMRRELRWEVLLQDIRAANRQTGALDG